MRAAKNEDKKRSGGVYVNELTFGPESPKFEFDNALIKPLRNPIRTFSCPRGHTWTAEFSTCVIASGTDKQGAYQELRRIDICPICYIEWVGRNCGGVKEV